MVRCFNCQIKIDLSEELCPWCGRPPFDGAVDEFASGDGVLLRYNGEKKDITLPEGLHTVGEQAFDCTSVRSVIIPEGYKTVEDAAFLGCSSLNYVEFPASLKKIGSHAFADCPYLREVTLPHRCKVNKTAFEPEVVIKRQ